MKNKQKQISGQNEKNLFLISVFMFAALTVNVQTEQPEKTPGELRFF